MRHVGSILMTLNDDFFIEIRETICHILGIRWSSSFHSSFDRQRRKKIMLLFASLFLFRWTNILISFSSVHFLSDAMYFDSICSLIFPFSSLPVTINWQGIFGRVFSLSLSSTILPAKWYIHRQSNNANVDWIENYDQIRGSHFKKMVLLNSSTTREKIFKIKKQIFQWRLLF